MDRRTRRQYEGVIYTPGRRVPSNKNARRTGKKQQKSRFALFYTLTLFTGVVVCIVVFATMFTTFLPGTVSQPPVTAAPKQTGGPPVAVASEKTLEAAGLIKTVGGGQDGSDKSITVYDIENFRTYNLTVDGSTDLKDKYGRAVAFAELSAGDIADIVYETRSSLLKSLKLSGQAWEKRQASRVGVDYVERTVTVDNDAYRYNDELISVSRGEFFDIGELKPIDVVTLRGYKDMLWYAELVRSHGYLDFLNKDLVMDGILEINNDYAKDLSETESLELLEGSQRVVIRGENIEDFSKEITIERGGTYVLDLAEVQYKMGVININVNVGEYTVFIDGAEVSAGEPLMLGYGEYSIKITKEDYLPYEGTLTVKEPSVSLDVELQEELQMCKLTINTYPAGAELYIDNSYVGISPLTTPVVYGKHKIIYSMPGYKTIDYEWTADKPQEVLDIYLQEDDPVMPPAYGF